ncbi:uncharacterized protein LOC130991020 [Salvia miltiorrhiza]|uniref:uncharacterized protein LOC130991020 n=1 Tax=Salvia miltiorrhiza TaxID=226208 RepID=UPI0025AD53B4|nr:uncharacterized protein LOC130991020 [Salvia miltiorrhiza]
MPSEDALQFIRDFCTQVQTFPLLELTEDQLRLKCLPYALKDRARTWLLSLPPNSITTWAEVMVDSTAGGNIARKTADELKEIFTTLAASSQQKSVRGRRVEANAVAPNNELQKQVADLMRQVQQLRMNQVEPQPVQAPPAQAPLAQAPPSEGCGICGDFSHGTNECHRMGEFIPEGEAEVYAAQGYLGRPQFEQRPIFTQGQQNSNSEMTKQNMESQSATIKRLETTVGQLSGTLNQMQQQQQPGKLHGQGLQPHQAQAVTVLRSGKKVDNKVETHTDEPPKETREEEMVKELPPPREEEQQGEPSEPLHKATKPYRPLIPYPGRLRNEKQDQQFTDFYNMLAKVNVNLPLLDVIRNVPAYVKFFKELASKKRKFVDNEKILVSEVANSIMQQPLPPKQ